jgi:hypothetical protein
MVLLLIFLVIALRENLCNNPKNPPSLSGKGRGWVRSYGKRLWSGQELRVKAGD